MYIYNSIALAALNSHTVLCVLGCQPFDGSVAVDSLFIVVPIVEVLYIFLSLCPFLVLCNRHDVEGSVPRGAKGWSSVCDCGISWSYTSLPF